MIAKMDAIEAPSKKQELKESASMNISMTGDDAGQVAQMMDIMRNAGMNPTKVSDKPLAPRMDMEKHIKALGAMDDDPNIPGRDDVKGDIDLKAGPGCGMEDAESDETAVEGDYANSPEEDYAPYTDVIKGGTDLNGPKKSYPKVAGGDNPMALEDSIKEQLANLYKEYKVDEAEHKDGKMPSKAHIMKMCKDGKSKKEICDMHKDCDQEKLKEMIDDCMDEMKDKE